MKRKEKVTPPSKQDTLVPKEKSIEDLNKEYLKSKENTSSLKRQPTSMPTLSRDRTSLFIRAQNLCQH